MNLTTFWHVAIMGSWELVTREQAAMFAQVGLRPRIGIVGPPCNRDFSQIGDVLFHHPDVREAETPTVQALWEWCKSLEHPENEAVLYCHTKGVSRPHNTKWLAWRLLMEKWVVRRWSENLVLLEHNDIVGVNYRDAAPVLRFGPHFSGNFWMARADWVRQLVSPVELRDSVAPRRKRYTPEMFICRKPGYRFVSLCCQQQMFAHGKLVYRLLHAPIT